MNKERRKEITALISQIEEAIGAAEGVLGEEEEYRDNIPENLQGTERSERAEEACENIEAAIDELTYACDSLRAAAE